MPRQSLCIAMIAFAVLLTAAPARTQGVPSAALSDYQAKLAQYTQVHQAYDAEAGIYWNAVIEKRHVRNAKRRDHQPIQLADYVLTQPPLYTGPPRPINPLAPGSEPGEKPPIPLLADFLQAAQEQYGFVPQRPASELEFKLAYARVARAASRPPRPNRRSPPRHRRGGPRYIARAWPGSRRSPPRWAARFARARTAPPTSRRASRLRRCEGYGAACPVLVATAVIGTHATAAFCEIS
jgi:hypothetical protein